MPNLWAGILYHTNITIFDQHEQRPLAVHTAAALKLTQTNRQKLIFVFIQINSVLKN